MNFQTIPFVLLLTIVLSFTTSSIASSQEEKIEWSQVPANVQKVITEHAQGGEILEIEKDMENNKVVYEAEVKKANGNEIEIKVDENGNLIEIEVEWSQVPASVQKTIREHAQGGEILEIEKEMENNRVIYEAEIKKADGTKIEIKVDENGNLIDIEVEDEDDEDDDDEDDND